jgi:UDP-glucose 4-epimerase
VARAHAAQERSGVGIARTILVTGGLGYIGSHTCVVLAEAGCRLVIVDNLANAKPQVLERIRALAPGAGIEFHQLDVRDVPGLERVMATDKPEAVVHFAGLKAVGESVARPVDYYDNNVGGSIALLQAMERQGVGAIVFSSSATVYGDPERLPLTEDHPLRPTNPYGKTKLMIEQILADRAAAGGGFRYAALRYFNPIGAHPSGTIGEDPRGTPNNLLPYISQVAVGKQAALRVWGNDYPTPDGTGVRDYIHVMDLARGHLAALEALAASPDSLTVNLGTGRGYSVLEALKAFERASGRAIPFQLLARRPGDVAACYADASRARTLLKWRAELEIDAMCRDGWRWQSQNPDGYV